MSIKLSDFFNSCMYNRPYETPLEHLQDTLALIKIYLNCYTELSSVVSNDENSSEESQTDLSILLQAWEHLASRENATPNNEYLPLIYIKNTFRLSFFEYLSLLLGLSVEFEDDLSVTYQNLCHNDYPSFYLAFCLYGMTDPVDAELFKEADLEHSSLRYLIHYNPAVSQKQPLMRHSICIRKSILLFLTGCLPSDEKYFSFKTASQDIQYANIHTDVYKSLLTYFENNKERLQFSKKIIVLEGPHGIGKHTLIKRLCSHFNAKCLFLNIDAVQKLDEVKQFEVLNDFYFYARINQGFICLSNCNEKINSEIYTGILNELKPFIYYMFLTFDEPLTHPLDCDNFEVLDLQLDSSSLSDKRTLWEYMKSKYSLTLDPKVYAGKYNLTIGTLEKILSNCKLIAAYNGSDKILEKHLIQGILSTNKLTDNTYLVKHPYTFDDLILDAKTINTLKHISNYVKNRHIIFEDWGFSQKLAYGKGINMLFYGSPGTGKTMCASVLANEWGLDLVKVDLSQVVDKYIGETEKRLNAIFDNAKKNNCVLFFDEADSLFSKRTEIQSANDKYANVEVSHLLQKLELYDGIVILATNLAQNFDDAFKRRIHFMIHFTLPDADIRSRLWEKAFPKNAPLDDDVDFDYLGQHYEISPSIIKSTALYSAFLAQSSNSSITMSHIVEAIRYEYEKSGRIMPC